MLKTIVGLLVCAWAMLAAPVSAEILYGADGAQGHSSNLYTLNPASGAVVSTVGAIGFAVTGLAVHVGARVAALAQAGEVLATSTVQMLVLGSGIGFADRGVHALKGVPDRWQLFAVERA